MEIGILIGSDCPRAIMPREIIPGEDDSPYALRSDLGWGIIGKISQPLSGEDGDEDEIGVSHRIYTIEACEPLDPQADLEGLNKRSCNFSVKTNVKEVINPFQVMKMFEMDFSEKRADRQGTLSAKTTYSFQRRWKKESDRLLTDIMKCHFPFEVTLRNFQTTSHWPYVV